MKFFLLIFLFCSGSHAACNFLFLSQQNRIDESLISKSLISVIETKNVDFTEVSPWVFSIITGFDFLADIDTSPAEFVRRLKPIQGWRHLIRAVDWEGHIYSEKSSFWSDNQYNTFWGRPFNMRVSDPVAIAIHHSAKDHETWVNFVVGFSDIKEVELIALERLLHFYDKSISLHKISFVDSNNNNFSLLVLAGIRPKFDAYKLLTKVINDLQERYLVKD